ncbi:MAG: bi-domain-containing oxidoreductase [Terriglobales bacterium]
MFQVTDNYWSGEVKLEEVPAPIPRPGTVLVRSVYSLISAGTERMKVQQAQMSLVGKARARPDQLRKVRSTVQQEGLLNTVQKVMSRLKAPVPLGYSLAGTVEALGADAGQFRVGDRVACGGSSANHAHFNVVPVNLCVPVPNGVSLDHAAFTTVGAIAMHAVRQTQAQFGELVVVVGLGLVGLLCLQMLRELGCIVVGVDLEPARLELASTMGAVFASRPDAGALHQQVRALSAGLGADAVLLAASADSADPVLLAGDLLRDRGRLVDVGKARLELPWEVFYDKELELRMARSYGPGRYDPSYEEQGVDYPVGYVRWTERRNMACFLDMVAAGKLNLKPMISHEYEFNHATDAYATLMNDHGALGIVLRYDRQPDPAPHTYLRLPRSQRASASPVQIGVIGAGNFCKSMLLPRLRRLPQVNLAAVCAATGLSAADTARRFGFALSTTRFDDVLADPAVTSVVIATRHHLHAPMATSALEAGKSVFVEKPLATTPDDLERVLTAAATAPGLLMVGYNRRFAPLVRRLRAWMANYRQPWIVDYRVNAGSLPANHWFRDPSQGGGRLLSELCHFVDTALYLCDSPPVEVSAAGAPPTAAIPADEHAVYSIRFASGSIATIIYTGEGDLAAGKERLEVIGNGGLAVLDNFRSLNIVASGRRQRHKTRTPDKGHTEELRQFVHAVESGAPSPIALQELSWVAETCFALQRALLERTPVRLR